MSLSQPKIKPLRGHGVFTKVITKGKRYEQQSIRVFICYAKASRISVRIGFTVTKRIHSAARRNRIKRLMREAFRANQKHLLKCIDQNAQLEAVFMFTGGKEFDPNRVQYSTIFSAFNLLCINLSIL